MWEWYQMGSINIILKNMTLKNDPITHVCYSVVGRGRPQHPMGKRSPYLQIYIPDAYTSAHIIKDASGQTNTSLKLLPYNETRVCQCVFCETLFLHNAQIMLCSSPSGRYTTHIWQVLLQIHPFNLEPSFSLEFILVIMGWKYLNQSWRGFWWEWISLVSVLTNIFL